MSAPPNQDPWPVIRQFYLRADLFWRSKPELRVPVKVLIDTGSDLTLFTVATLKRLEMLYEGDVSEMIGVDRRICVDGSIRPSYDLALLLPEAPQAVFSACGFVCVKKNLGSDIDMLLGQDLLNQWIVTLDGVKGTLTISEP